jgi:hypothetical protein
MKRALSIQVFKPKFYLQFIHLIKILNSNERSEAAL